MPANGSFVHRYGPWALIAGGSEGLGAAFAEEAAARGLNLVLVARRAEKLAALAAELRAAHGVQVKTVTADLAEPAALEKVLAEAAGLEIGLFVHNAAVASTGWFLDTPLAEYTRMLDVNCRAAVVLLHTLAAKMAERGRGGIVLMGSLSSFHGTPVVSVYGATKAFLLSMAEALGAELGDSGVDVEVCCPAVVTTPHLLGDGHNPEGPMPMAMTPQAVARAAIQGLGRKRIVVPGAASRVVHFLTSRLMPRQSAVSMIGRNTRAMYGRKGV
jgi:uncharacterized protein